MDLFYSGVQLQFTIGELFRIISMLMIVAHHYVVNSGLLDCMDAQSSLRLKDYFLLLFGWGGKTGINCFVLITGYFMCTSNITKMKFFKLLGEVYFYKVIIWGIFFLSGYEPLSAKEFLKMLFRSLRCQIILLHAFCCFIC